MIVLLTVWCLLLTLFCVFVYVKNIGDTLKLLAIEEVLQNHAEAIRKQQTLAENQAELNAAVLAFEHRQAQLATWLPSNSEDSSTHN